ncbi:hypothetical protein IV203_034084 [Nitzschia inconspicua]|uniref:Uncharacterized protein n=1 Tax=Nitzschia inconspicua TaxID=303405 RepID=A0A9K3Q7L2_9STRA|nr:hypothetical protein IV203_034084 [Nitzschia inconspicua]
MIKKCAETSLKLFQELEADDEVDSEDDDEGDSQDDDSEISDDNDLEEAPPEDMEEPWTEIEEVQPLKSRFITCGTCILR